MTASTSPAARMPCPEATFGNPSTSKNGASPCFARNSRPQKPYTTLGIAASNSRRNAHTFRNRGGASSERYAAAPTPSGTATSIAISDVTIVPYTNTSAPYWSPSGYHLVLVSTRYLPGSDRTGHALYTSTATSAAAIASTNPPADWHSQRKK